MLHASLCAKIMVFRRITRIIGIVLNERTVRNRQPFSGKRYVLYAVSLPLRQTLNDMNMEIVSIEKKTFEMMVAAFGALSEKVAALRRKSDTGRMERWLTGEEVCGQLRISPRTLQTLRDRRLIGYSQINRRFYYKPEEVKRLIPLVGTLYPHGR